MIYSYANIAAVFYINRKVCIIGETIYTTRNIEYDIYPLLIVNSIYIHY